MEVGTKEKYGTTFKRQLTNPKKGDTEWLMALQYLDQGQFDLQLNAIQPELIIVTAAKP